MSLSVTCKKCKQTSTIPDRYKGRDLNCPKCGTPFETREKTQVNTGAPRQCPFCKEEIHPEAIKCKHCESMLTDERPSGGGSPVAATKRSDGVGLFLLIIPTASIFLMWGWIGQMNMLQGPGSSLAMVMALTVLGTAALAAGEASTLGMGGPGDVGKHAKKREGPVAWFFLILLLWIICYPMYMKRRGKYGVHDHFLIALLLTLAVVASAYLVGSAIDLRQQQILSIFS